ncbi:ankyrin repeat protein, putative [Trichomonas vaginalis G3]|uniref:Ankyrin repeat protein, putative n=1 Tax=Trichomonas vaginalis (strain ATCC PRA-98 / G3) TaxID=412133 RepID=A2DAD9_TRIV3|nr:spectrin binding [Trichomonas vaginalis G3]EAY22787.1 ankyrin repeat protein, putative [Trichomonas vaginalis G3]KAI5525598.1 spectrin binding [Trichomonas vaginalis G3]|eukprot:XP_001583773.1 ankyrin repeat protein [Trichomonas vaginalis G3]
MIYEEYRPKNVCSINPLFDYFVYKEYGLVLNEKSKEKFELYDSHHYSLDVHKPNTIWSAIMEDDNRLLISITNGDDFDKDQKIISDFYPKSDSGYTLLEICCYHGAVKCFRYLMTELHLPVTKLCSQFSFIGKNLDIVSDCSKVQKPDYKSMRGALLSHNIDFILYLFNEHKIEINLSDSLFANNLQAIFMYYEKTSDLINSFVYSASFNIPAVSQYFLTHRVNINAKSKLESCAIHHAVQFNCKENLEFLISKGADVNSVCFPFRYPLHLAAENNSVEACLTLLLNHADQKLTDRFGRIPLHEAAANNATEVAEILIKYGAIVDSLDCFGATPLHEAAKNNNVKIAELLLSHGADANDIDNKGQTPLYYSIWANKTQIAEFLISHGGDVNAVNNDGVTVLARALNENKNVIAEFLVSHDAVRTLNPGEINSHKHPDRQNRPPPIRYGPHGEILKD